MSEGQSANNPTNPEALALLKENRKYGPLITSRQRRNAISGPSSGPSRSPIGKKELHRGKKYWPTSRFERAGAPSPETPEWPTNFCLIMECDLKAPHTHTKKQIIDRIGYASWMEDLFQPPLSKAGDSEEYDGLYCGRSSGMSGSSILNSVGKGTNELLEALPNIDDVVKHKPADEHNSSSSAVSEVAAGLENLNIQMLNKGKSRE